MLVPEKVARFRVAAPAEYEVALLDALASIGEVHLEPSLGGERSALPSLYVDVLEGRVNYANLNVEEALEVTRRILREGDPLLSKLEGKVAELRNIEEMRVVVERLDGMGISPDRLGRESLGIVTDYVFVSDENVTDAVHEFLRAGAIVRRSRVSHAKHILVLIYGSDKASSVNALKAKYGLQIALPSWFFDKTESVLRRLEEEETRIRKEIIDIIIEVSSVLRDAFEFEHATRLEIVSNALRAIENSEKQVDKLEKIFYDTLGLLLGYRFCLEKKMLLAKYGVKKAICELSRKILIDEPVEPGEFEKLLSSLFSQEEAAAQRMELEKLNRLLVIRKLLRSTMLSGSSGKAFVVSAGDKKLEEAIASAPEIYGAKVVGELRERGVIAVVFEVAETLEEAYANFLRDKFRASVVEISDPSKELEEALAKLERSIFSAKNSILSSIISKSLRKFKVDVKKVLEELGEQELREVYSYIAKMRRGVEQKSIPEGDRFVYLKTLIGLADETSEEILHLEEELNVAKSLPSEALADSIRKLETSLVSVSRRLAEILSYKAVTEAMYRAHPLLSEVRIFRSRRIVVVEGYVPVKYVGLLEDSLRGKVPRLLYFKYSEVPRSAGAPTYIERRGLKKYLYSLTSMRGTPAYWEIDPTLIFTAMFVVMYGMMFGDIGQGLVLSAFGAWLLKTKYRLLGITSEGAATLGALSLMAGISSMVFGAVYGFMFFLKPLAHPIIAPIHDIYEIIAVALWFGVAQLVVAMALNMVNLWRMGDNIGAVFSGMGGLGLLFYLSGVVVAYNLATTGFNLAVLSSPSLTPFLLAILASILGVLGYGLYESIHGGEKEKIMHAVSEVIEMIIALPANSLSYIRLAAFAMAHEAFGILAENLTPSVGEIASYAVANLLVLGIEGLAVGIQAMRLTYYEFSTKFFKGVGVEFKPISTRIRFVTESSQ
ncbi:V-type ATPase 116kDa subunit family protein [Thermofilum pendens]|uniref:A-type ATP synthase subunit I n=1 Tax=Thermofilum pendens (strain DSM 2475 / Hrk 5) TaxID=368408 RepID=A1RX16_THEPD|nr:V-type ATPase 116kDa subunit family protein [Thermofilum pendens]ABL77746.1 V-type ATPase, 116 kDa subunit [Thermofilum pendens Hrk 5]